MTIQVPDSVGLLHHKEYPFSINDDMGSRINEHEQSIGDLRAEIRDVQGTPPPSASKSDDEPKTPAGSS
ncbi:unnamed protein product [Thlaspi arvense]|uniref:Uncharacterized protein n=1 Tax=Thlaspi arvense TaxID=13288 RepID=A0AAU9RZV7_THLAR|nr:unnamed protein product [Thlaspi arvense]